MKIVIGHVALIQRTKRHDFVLRVIHELRERGHDVVGLFPGECREPEFMRELEMLVEELGLTGSVLFLGRRNDIPDLLKTIDILIIPSTEGFPLAGLEAAAAGVPVAACNVAGAKEFIVSSGDGLFFEEGNISAAADTIINVINSKDEMIQSGKVFVEQMSYKKYSEKAKGLFDSVK